MHLFRFQTTKLYKTSAPLTFDGSAIYGKKPVHLAVIFVAAGIIVLVILVARAFCRPRGTQEIFWQTLCVEFGTLNNQNDVAEVKLVDTKIRCKVVKELFRCRRFDPGHFVSDGP